MLSCKFFAIAAFYRQKQQVMTLPEADSEAEIIRLFRRGDPLAMDRLYAAHADYLTGVCARYIGDDDELRDILQECFIKIYTRFDSFEYRGRGSLRAWLSRIVMNQCIQTLRNRQRRPTTLLDAEPPDLPDETPDTDGMDPDTVMTLMRRLPDGYRTVLNLFVIEGKSHKEIAKMLGIKPDTSASQLHRAKCMLAQIINEYKRSKQ